MKYWNGLLYSILTQMHTTHYYLLFSCTQTATWKKKSNDIENIFFFFLMEKYPQGSPRAGEGWAPQSDAPKDVNQWRNVWKSARRAVAARFIRMMSRPGGCSRHHLGTKTAKGRRNAGRYRRRSGLEEGGTSRAAGLKQQGAWTRWEHAMDRKVTWMDLW